MEEDTACGSDLGVDDEEELNEDNLLSGGKDKVVQGEENHSTPTGNEDKKAAMSEEKDEDAS